MIKPQKGIDERELLTPAEAAQLIGAVAPRTVTRWCRGGFLPASRINGRWYICRAQLLQMLQVYEGRLTTDDANDSSRP